MFTIEKGIPLSSPMKGELTATLRAMQVGDSFVYPDKLKRGNVVSIAKRAGIRISTRAMPDSSLRVWRIE